MKVTEFSEQNFQPIINYLCSRRSSQCIRLNSDKPQTTVFCVFVFHPKVSKFGHFFDRTFSIKPPNIQIRSRVADPHKRGIEFKYLSSPFCPTAAEILHQPPSLPPHPPPICLTPIFLQFKGWTLPKLQNSAPPK